ncbi:nitrilase-related carbon-nitrogen hydrolase [Zhihengliuella halotolerans]|uniref:Putative amidohydrolase n=1 Tax=Zhihengliuella halotolerans TaxID=370736 RepID=A0A4Q8ADG0_9MICC|nr:nitrilase-related carbon-nitrogen hydrolase [Zhihengliuella halotolerans]RZU62280.1 putative amidohydrolase [Zhihengliuella halotolerans]
MRKVHVAEESPETGASVSVAVAQAEAVVGDIEANLSTLAALIERAAGQGADVVVTPELFATGYDPAGAWRHDGAAIRDAIAGLARACGIAVIGSTIETRHDDGGPRHYIAASFFSASGRELARSLKAHLFGAAERAHLGTLGYGSVFEFNGLRCAMGTCYDVEFPEFVRHGARAGAQLFLVPTAVPALHHQEPGRGPAWSYDATQTSLLQVPARALENGVAIAYANHAAAGFTAHSCIATPYGRNAALIEAGEGVAVVRVDAASIDAARRLNTYLVDVDRPGLRNE